MIFILPPIAETAASNLKDTTQTLLNGMVYHHGARNGVAPDLFHDRVAVHNIMSKIPKQHQNWTDNEAVLRIQIHGPPGSGKTSIMGKIDQLLKEKYSDTPRFFVRAAELKTRKEEVTHAISGVPTCVVLLDDAQDWYDYKDFWALFKASPRLLVFAATYSVTQFNPLTPVEVQFAQTSNLLPHEVGPLLTSLGIEECHHENMEMWYGNNYGRYAMLVPEVIRRWEQQKTKHPTITLAETFSQAETMENVNGRLLPTLSDEMRNYLMAEWSGQVNVDQRKKLARYGMFDEDGRNWSCEYVRRKYFDDLFHPSTIDESLFDAHSGLPPELDLLKAGLRKIQWHQVKQCAGSSLTGFPLEDVWQAEFYGSIGGFIPRELVFCKEYVAKTDNRVDFVLRNGSTRAIEFLIKSSDVNGHHNRFEKGAYKSLRLSGSYLVVDIKPWGNQPDIHDVPDASRLGVATQCFEALDSTRRKNHHAVFLVSNDLSSGILYTYNLQTSSVVECLRSPPPLPDMEA